MFDDFRVVLAGSKLVSMEESVLVDAVISAV